MSRIAMPEPEVLPDYLRALHDGAPERDWSTRHCARAFASAPELLEQYLTGFYYNWHSNAGAAAGVARLSTREKELVRLRIATLNGCQTCRAARLSENTVSEDEALSVDAYEEAGGYSERERLAIRLAERMALDHLSIDDESIREMRDHFDDAELLELLMMAGQYIGFGRLLAVLQLEEVACPI
jgi:alkylhydroperoxidase family enzyme